MSFRGHARVVVFACAVFACTMMAACDDAPEPQSQGKATTAGADTGRKPTALPPGMVSAVYSGKGSASISVHFELGATPTVGITLPVDIAVVPNRKFSSVRATFVASDGLQMSQDQQPVLKSEVEPGQVLRYKLQVQPTREGIYLINVGVETEGDEGNITRSYAIPVIVDAAAGGGPPAG